MLEIDLDRLPERIRSQVTELAQANGMTIEQAYLELATSKLVVEALNRHKRRQRMAKFTVVEGSGGAARGPLEAKQ